MSLYNDYSREEWLRAGVADVAISDWSFLDFDLELPRLPDGALRMIPPREVWFWERQGIGPVESVPMILEGRGLSEVIGERSSEPLVLYAPSFWQHLAGVEQSPTDFL